MAITRIRDVTLSTDTSAYANGDLLADTQTLSDMFYINDGTGIIKSLTVVDTDDNTLYSFSVWFLDGSGSLGTVDDLVERPGPHQSGQPGRVLHAGAGRTGYRADGLAVEAVVPAAAQDDPKQRRPDISLAESRLDWRPAIPLREGLVRTKASLPIRS